ncbi:MAG TPA: ABC transporter permease subunit [Clostridia bacterium]|nr:ABC transporter permease subunit [Clostridia bacterium]
MLYLLLLTPFAYFVIFKYAPMYGVLIAFKDYNIFEGVWASEWNNFETFIEIFSMPDFWNAFRNTFVLNTLDLVVGFPAPIILAIILGELKIMWFKRATQTILYLPHFLSWVIIGSIALQLLAPESGLVNIVLNKIGISSIPFLNDKYLWVGTYVVLGLWQSIGWNTIIYLAAISGINPELYEAAEMDGAGRLSRIWHITLPGIRPTIVILLILAVGRMSQIGFDRPYVLSNYFVTETADVISTFVYRLGIQNFQYSIATAVGLFQSVIGLVFLLVTNYIADRLGEQGIW